METMEMSEEEEDTVTMIIETTEDFAKKARPLPNNTQKKLRESRYNSIKTNLY